jgi:hypothetical protein
LKRINTNNGTNFFNKIPTSKKKQSNKNVNNSEISSVPAATTITRD